MATTISEKTRRRIEEGIRNWHDLNSPARKRYEASAPMWAKEIRQLEEAVARSERITEEDLNIIINTR